jgi:pectate lyase
MRRLLCMILVVVAAACGEGIVKTVPDGPSADDVSDGGYAPSPDAGQEPLDAGGELPDAGGELIDAGMELPDAGPGSDEEAPLPLYGFAHATGGEGGSTVRVTNATDFLRYAQSSSPYVIEVSGTIALAAGMHSLQSNKTIVGVGSTARTTGGGLYFRDKTNIIIRNITFTGVSDDCIGLDGTTNVLIANNDFSDAGDGLVDVYRGSTNVTVSWNRFSNHDLTSLVGHDDAQTSDRGKLRVTYHHNWFDGVDQRMPRVRYGEVHVFNNYYRGNDSLYALGVGVEAKILSENNYFENIPATFYLDTTSQRGYARDVGSHFVGAGSSTAWRPDGVTWDPGNHYAYTLDDAVDVKSIVMARAGVARE